MSITRIAYVVYRISKTAYGAFVDSVCHHDMRHTASDIQHAICYDFRGAK
jgi:hypothetical protein